MLKRPGDPEDFYLIPVVIDNTNWDLVTACILFRGDWPAYPNSNFRPVILSNFRSTEVPKPISQCIKSTWARNARISCQSARLSVIYPNRAATPLARCRPHHLRGARRSHVHDRGPAGTIPGGALDAIQSREPRPPRP